MTRLGRQIERGEGADPHDVDDVEHLFELHEVAELGIGPGSPPPVEIAGEGRPGDRREVDGVATHLDVARRIARMEGEDGRCGGDRLLHKARFQENHLRGLVHAGACLFQKTAGLAIENLHAEFVENPERGAVNGLDLVVRERRNGREGIAHLAPWQEVKRLALAAETGSAPASTGHRLFLSPHPARLYPRLL